VRPAQTINPESPAASAVRKIAPTLPGFSTPSTIAISGGVVCDFNFAVNAAKDASGGFAVATTPSCRSPKASFCMTIAVTSSTSAPQARACRASCFSTSGGSTSASINSSVSCTPPASARSISRRPSMMIRCRSSRPCRSRSLMACLIRGFCRLVMGGRIVAFRSAKERVFEPLRTPGAPL
jgi:hypothetical protein